MQRFFIRSTPLTVIKHNIRIKNTRTLAEFNFLAAFVLAATVQSFFFLFSFLARVIRVQFGAAGTKPSPFRIDIAIIIRKDFGKIITCNYRLGIDAMKTSIVSSDSVHCYGQSVLYVSIVSRYVDSA